MGSDDQLRDDPAFDALIISTLPRRIGSVCELLE